METRPGLIKFSNRNGEKLAGIIEIPKNPNSVVLLMVHGFACDKNENGLFVEAARKALDYGYTVFRYDCRGLGESEGTFENTTLQDHVNDFQDAIDYIAHHNSVTHSKNLEIGVIGFSLGATIAIMGNSSRIKSLVLWSPALYPHTDMWPRYNIAPIKAEIEEHGYFIKDGKKVGPRLLNDLRDSDLVPYIERVKCPTLIVHGSADQKIRMESSEVGIKQFIGHRTRVRIIHGASHSFKTESKHRAELFHWTTEWFKIRNF